MSLTTFPTETGHCVQITTTGVVDGTLRISGYGLSIKEAQADAIEKLRKYVEDKKKHTPTRQEAIEKWKERKCLD